MKLCVKKMKLLIKKFKQILNQLFEANKLSAFHSKFLINLKL
jgi:hypothetical protein